MNTILRNLYALTLYAFPRDFRREFGPEMRQVFDTRLRRTQGAGSALLYLLRVAVDGFWTALREHASRMWMEGRRSTIRRPLAEWTATIAVYLFVSTTLVQAYVVPTGSMEGNIRIGDHLLVDRVAYANPGPGPLHLLPYRPIERGDIVAFHPPHDPSQTYVKRVIGLAGDRIRLDHKQVVRNGHRLIEPYAQHVDSFTDAYRDNFPNAPPTANVSSPGYDMLAAHVRGGEVVVPEGSLFLLGDNRDDSLDSRYWGFAPRKSVVGKPLLVYWSYDAPTERWLEWRWDHLADVAKHFIGKTRWERFLMVPKHQDAVQE